MNSRVAKEIVISALMVTAGAIAFSIGAPKGPQHVKRGYLPFEEVRVGISEDKVKKAIFSFALDHGGCVAGKVQYLSRNFDPQGGQYILHSRNNQVYEVQVLYSSKPVSHDAALAQMKRLLPSDAPATANAVPDSGKSSNGSESYNFGYRWRGELVPSLDKKGISIVSTRLEPATASQ